MKPEDINYILNIVPNFSYGRRQGLSDEDTIRKSNQVWHELEDALEKQAITERAISAFIGQAGENDGYLGCYMVHRQNHQHCQTGDTVKSLDELVEWYKENFPEEVHE